MKDCISDFILVSKSSGTIIHEFCVDFSRTYEYDLCEEYVLTHVRYICNLYNFDYDDVHIYERCYFKD